MTEPEHEQPVDFGRALRMRQVSKRYPGTLAVDRVDFEARVGEVHALMGENGAGKSTLMKVLAGTFNDYTGHIRLGGKEVRLHSPAAARAHGIGMIHQELSLAGPLSVAENLLVGRLPRKYGFVLDRQAMIRESRRCLQRVGLDLDPLTPVEEISQHEAQLVEIAKVLGGGPCVLVMDEPTSALSRQEVERLFQLVERMKRQGLTIVYISHHLSEVFRLADRVTVLRDGRKVATRDLADVTPAEVVQMMVGRTIDEFYTQRTPSLGPTTLRVHRLTRRGFFHDVSFAVRAGEIVGIAGLSGAGRSELARSMCGLDPVDGGTVELNGNVLKQSAYPETVAKGLVYLCEDRKAEGLFLRQSVTQNLVAALLPRYTTAGLYSPAHEQRTTNDLLAALDIVTASAATEVGNLSGGNQQKVLLGKWLAVDPAVLVLDEPTRGVDVGAKRRIHETVMSLADRGKAVLLISSDLPELVGLSDRVLVLREGHLLGELPKERLSEESVLLAMNGQLT